MARKKGNDEIIELIISLFGLIFLGIGYIIKELFNCILKKPQEKKSENSINISSSPKIEEEIFSSDVEFIYKEKNNKNIKKDKNTIIGKEKINMTELEMAQFIYRCKGKKDNIYDFPKYMYNSGNLREKINFMLENGYLRYSEYKDELENLTVSDLKTILKEYKLKSTGKKAELIDRILENRIKRDELLNVLKTDVLLPTDKGKELIENNKWWEE